MSRFPASGGIALKPNRCTFEQAAAVNVAGVTALQALRRKAQVQPGQKVLINGASGGVGTFAVQIAKAFGRKSQRSRVRGTWSSYGRWRTRDQLAPLLARAQFTRKRVNLGLGALAIESAVFAPSDASFRHAPTRWYVNAVQDRVHVARRLANAAGHTFNSRVRLRPQATPRRRHTRSPQTLARTRGTTTVTLTR
jgi:hypothetical protein